MLRILSARLIIPTLYASRSVAFKAVTPLSVSRASIWQRSIASTPYAFFPAPKSITKRPAAKKAVTKKSVARKSVAKKAAAKKTKAKPTTTSKKPKPKPKPVTVKITPEMKRPKRPAPPFLTFCTKFIAATDRPKTTLADRSTLTKEAGEVWMSFTALEKQPFLDEYRLSLPPYRKKIEQWLSLMQKNRPAVLAINKKRRARGQTRIRVIKPEAERRPMNTYLRFSNSYMDTHNDVKFSKIAERAKVISAAWRTLPKKDKEVYQDQYNADVAQWKAQH